MYKKFIFDDKSVLRIKDDTIIFPHHKAYKEYLDWVKNNQNDYIYMLHEVEQKRAWQGFTENIKHIRGDLYERVLYHDVDEKVKLSITELIKKDNTYQPHGQQVTFCDDGKTIKSVQQFRYGFREGHCENYFKDSKKIMCKEQYTRGLPVGIWEYYNWNGDVVANEFYKNGKIAKKITYKDDIETSESNWNALGNMHGKYRDSHNNGEMRARGSLKDGDMDGKWSFYYDNGNPNYNVVFKHGSPIHLEFFTIDGKLLWEKKL